MTAEALVERLSITEAIGNCVVKAPVDLHDGVRADRAAIAFADTIGVALAGAAEASAQIARSIGLAQFGTSGPASTSVFGDVGLLSTAGAAFVNGVAAHALDFDDVSSTVEGHPSALLVPVLLALAERQGASGAEVLEAYLVGLHVSSSLAAGFDLRATYARGWHLTSVLGAVGGIAAASRLRGLGFEQVLAAIGIAGSLAAGSRANFGTMTKPLHVGATAAQTILAVDLAGSGFTANPQLIDAPFGFLDLHVVRPVDGEAVHRALAGTVGAAVVEVDIKNYPCCSYSHRMIDAAVSLKSQLAKDDHPLESIEQILVTAGPGGTAGLMYPRPATGVEAKFSGEYLVATALIDGAISETSFQDAALCRSNVRALMDRIIIQEAEIPPFGPPSWSDSYAVVEVASRDGWSHVERIDVPKGFHRNPLSRAEVKQKFVACAGHHPSAHVDGPAAFELIGGIAGDEQAGTLMRRVLQT